MDKTEWINRRRGKYMAQTLEEFENNIEPLISSEAADDFKALVRRKFNALAVDACELMKLDPNTQMNGAAQAIRDTLHPDGRLGSDVGKARPRR